MLVNYKTWKRLNENTDRIDSSGATLTVRADGSKLWYLNGKQHRVDGPAIESASGSKWWYLNGNRHRVDGPAVEWANGTKEWWVNNNRHRVDGPAVEWANGIKRWFIADTELTYDEFIKSLNDILDDIFVQKRRGITISKTDAIKGIIPDAAEIKTILGIRDNDSDILSELEGVINRSKDKVGLIKMAKAIAAVFGGDISIVKWLKTKMQNTFNASEINMIVNYFHKNTFELEGLDSLFGHSSDDDW